MREPIENTSVQPAENTSMPREGVLEKGADLFPGQTFSLTPASEMPTGPGNLAGPAPTASAAPAAPASSEGGGE